MDFKRIVLLAGHYGSGKTNIAVNLALRMKERHERVALADIDTVNPYFRSADSAELLEKHGIRLICSKYARSNLDLPSLPQEMYAIADDPGLHAVIDVGGDDRGAYALGRWSTAITGEDHEMLFVFNAYRPLTRDAESAMEILREIETACGMQFTGIVNCSNLGAETTVENILASRETVHELCRISGLPLKMTAVEMSLCPLSAGKIDDLFPLRLQEKIL